MFCPICGESNPAGSRFCNQCGATIAATAQGGATTTGQGRPASTTGQGTTTGDRIELPMVGPSKRTIVAMILGVGLGCLGLGALAAWKTMRQSSEPPMTPVGLFGEPTSVAGPDAPSDGGVLAAPTDPAPTAHPARPHPTTVASNAHPTPTGSSPNPSGGQANPSGGQVNPSGGQANPSGGQASPGRSTAGTTGGEANPTGTEPAPAPTAVEPPAAPTDPAPTPTAPTPAGPLPAEPGGVRERVPGTPAGSGFRLGDETDATGHMDPAAFRFVYDHYRSQIASCYSNASRNIEVSGVIVVRVRIGEDGHVRSTRIISDSAHTPSLTQCVQTSVRSWAYPHPEGGEVEVDYPMRFGSSR